MKIKKGQKIPIDELIDPEVVLHPAISKWRDALTVDLGLLNSLKEGQIQPVVFRLLDDKHELLVGSRRYFHQKLLETPWEKIPKDIRENVSDQAALLMAASENIFRQDFNPFEEARAIHDLVEKGGMTAKEVAKKLRKSESYVNSRRALLKLPSKVRKRFEKKEIPISYAPIVRKLSGMEEAQEEMLSEIEKGLTSEYSGFRSVNAADNFVTRVMKKKQEMEERVKKYGACPKCESKKIEEGWRDGQLRCNDCDHSWHKETKEPWAYFEMKQRAEEMGFKVEEGPESVKFTPKQMAKMIKEEAEKEYDEEEEPEEEKVPEKFRSKIPLETILAPIIKENLQKIVVRGSSIEIELIESSELYFKGLKKDYKAGEKARIEVEYSYIGRSLQETAKRVHGLIQSAST